MYPLNSPLASNPNFPSALKFFQDLDKYSHYFTHFRHPLQATSEQHLKPTFFPSFDVRELENDFELHGELPGVKRQDIKIEFSGPKTLEISGFVESSYSYPPRIKGQNGSPVAQNEGEEGQSGKQKPKLQEKGNANDTGDVTKTISEEVGQPSSVKYWASERSLGEFHRSFTFPCQVRQDSTTATLESGVLTVHIPKMSGISSQNRVVQVT